VFHTEEIVVKPMSTKLRHIDMFSGNTIWAMAPSS
jgi:two-component system chemotaxis sensor kinase CheA